MLADCSDQLGPLGLDELQQIGLVRRAAALEVHLQLQQLQSAVLPRVQRIAQSFRRQPDAGHAAQPLDLQCCPRLTTA